MSAKGKNNKIKGGSGQDLVKGGLNDDFVDGKSGDDIVSGGAGSDWAKGGSGNDVLRYEFAANREQSNSYDGGSGIDALLLELTFDQWMQADVQLDVERYLAWLPLQLNARGMATGEQSFQFNSAALNVRKVESLRVEVDGIEITPEDDPVELQADFFSADEDQASISGNVLLNDSVLDLVRSVEIVQGPGQGIAEINVSGDFTYSYGDIFQHLAPGESAEVTFSYRVQDADLDDDVTQVTMTITGVNDAPIALDDSATVDEDSFVAANVMANDSDIDVSDSFKISRVDQSAKGGVASIVDGEIHFDTNNDFESLAVGQSESVVIRYEIEDTHGATAEADLTISVTGVNDAPEADLDYASTSESGNVLIDVLANDTDVDNGAQFTVTKAQVVYGEGKASISGNKVLFDTDGKFEHLGTGQQEEIIIEYTMQDEHGATSTSAAFVVINGEYDAPVMVQSLSGFSPMSAEFANQWHTYRLSETGKASGLNFSNAASASSWNTNWQMGFTDQSIFGLGKDGLRAEAGTAGFSVNPGKTDVFSVDATILGTGASASAWIDPEFSMYMTPYVDVDGGKVNTSHAIDAMINSLTSQANGFFKLNTQAAASASNNITLDMPDAYSAGIEMDITARLDFGATVSGTIAGVELGTWNESGNLLDVDETVDLLAASIDTKEGELVLTMLDQDYVVKTVALPKNIGTVELFDESDELITATISNGLQSATSVTQPVTGLRLDIDDLLGNLPKVGPVFAALDDKKSYGVPDLGSIYFDYTVLGAGFSLGLGMGSDARTEGQFTVDLLFERPVYVEGFADPVMALRNADWFDLPGIKSADGDPVSVIPVFNSELGFSTDLTLNLTGVFDYKIGEANVGVTLGDVINESYGVGPLASDEVEVFDVQLITLGTVSYGSSGYDQFQGNAFMLG